MKQLIMFLFVILLFTNCESTTNHAQEVSSDTTTQITDPRVAVTADDPRLIDAKQQALKNLDFFIEMLGKHGLDTTYMFSIKADFEEDGKHEHMWIETGRYENGVFYGVLGNMPQMITSHKFGDKVSINRDAVEDWMIETPETDSIMGAYSVKALGQGNLLNR